MRIAVASEGLEVAPFFGHCASFMCYKVERGVITECQNMPNPRMPASRLAPLLRDLGVTTLIVGTIERDAADAFRTVDIDVVPNRRGAVRDEAEAYLARTLIGGDEWRAEEEEEENLHEA